MSDTPSLLAYVITRNEESRIGDCLRSLAFADRIIVVDNDSTDRTTEIARSYGAEVISSATGDFSRLRSLALPDAREDWILYVDADEIVPQKLANEIRRVMVSASPTSATGGYFIKRENHYLGRKWPVGDRMQRLFRRSMLIGWEGSLHESARIRGEYGELDHVLVHHTHRTLREMVEKTNSWSETEAQLRLNAHHPPVVPWRLFRVMLTGFVNSYFRQGGWRAGTHGVIEGVFQGFSMFVTYAKLWEKQSGKVVHHEKAT